MMAGTRVSLLEMRPGDTGVVVGLGGGRGFQNMLRSRGLVEGKEVQVVARLPGGPVVIRMGATEVAIGRGMAGRIWVETRA